MSIVNNVHHANYEIILADDNSTDETQHASNQFKQVTLVRNKTNLGFLRNCNNAVQQAKGSYIVLLNNDTEVKEGWLEHLVNIMEDCPDVGVAGSRLIYPDGKLQEAGGIIWKDGTGWNFGRLDDPKKPEYNYVKEVDYVSGACLMIRKELWDNIGGFDERFVPAYYEDTDLAFAVRNKGFEVVYQPKSVLIHHEGQSHGTDEKEGIKKFQKVNQQKFLAKWKDVLERNHFPNGQNLFYAKDRSRARKAILVIDHYVPHFDKDAGSRSTFQYLKIFGELGLNVKFLGDNFFKHEPYTSVLQDMGIEVLYGEYYQLNWKTWIRENAGYLDYIYLHRPHISAKYIDFCREHTKARILYQCHDLHFVRKRFEYELTKDSRCMEESNKWKKQEYELFKKSDVVLSFNRDEVALLKKDFPRKKIFQIPLLIFEEFPYETAEFDNRQGIMFVGGFGHPPNVDGVLWFVREVFPKVLAAHPDLKFTIAGSNPPDDVRNLESENIEVLGFITDDELEDLYGRARLVVVPLRYGAGVKGKVIEALYHGVPVVTTRFGLKAFKGYMS